MKKILIFLWLIFPFVTPFAKAEMLSIDNTKLSQSEMARKTLDQFLEAATNGAFLSSEGHDKAKDLVDSELWGGGDAVQIIKSYDVKNLGSQNHIFEFEVRYELLGVLTPAGYTTNQTTEVRVVKIKMIDGKYKVIEPDLLMYVDAEHALIHVNQLLIADRTQHENTANALKNCQVPQK